MLNEAEKILTQLDEVAEPNELDEYSLETLVKLLIQGREMVRIMRDIAGRIEQATVRAMPHRKMVIDGIGTVEKTTETARKEWDHPLVAGQVLRSATDSWAKETGEIVDQELAGKVLDAFMAAARMEWRVTALKDLGINPDNYCETTYGSQKIRVTRV